MNPYQETFETWNKIASLYEEKFMELDLYNQSYDAFCALLKKDNPKLLEIGCGPGNITKYLLTKHPHFNILGIDVAPNMVQLAKKNNPTAQFELMDTRNINTLTTTFDAIIGGFCLPYLSKKECTTLITDCNKLLTEKGILYISFVEGEEKDSGYKTSSNGDRVFFNYHSLKQLETDLKLNAFTIENTIKVDYPKQDGIEIHSIIIAKKKPLQK